MTTAALVDAYELPVEVVVTGGYYGKSEEQSLSEGELMCEYGRQRRCAIGRRPVAHSACPPCPSPL